MENLSDNRKNDVLPEFQAFLLDKKLAQEKNVFFYALWAGKFPAQSVAVPNFLSVFCPGNVRTAIFGDLTPPPDSISVDEAVDYIFQELEKKSIVIIFPQQMRDFDKLYRENRPKFDKIARNLAAERRENYRTKGAYC